MPFTRLPWYILVSSRHLRPSKNFTVSKTENMMHSLISWEFLMQKFFGADSAAIEMKHQKDYMRQWLLYALLHCPFCPWRVHHECDKRDLVLYETTLSFSTANICKIWKAWKWAVNRSDRGQAWNQCPAKYQYILSQKRNRFQHV